MPTKLRLLPTLALAGLAVLPSCATLSEGSAQNIHIETDPADARCELTRDGAMVTRIPSTPATISLYRDSGDLRLTCRKDGYLDATLDSASAFQDMVLGNILFGGLIGVLVDAGSGATRKYPESITLTLVPESFASEAERDAYFEALRVRLKQRAAAQAAKLRETCSENDCESKLKQLDQALERHLAFLDSQKAASRIEPSASE